MSKEYNKQFNKFCQDNFNNLALEFSSTKIKQFEKYCKEQYDKFLHNNSVRL